MIPTAITSGRDNPDYPAITNDKSDEIHVVWDETISGHSALSYWNNIPHTPDTMAVSGYPYPGGSLDYPQLFDPDGYNRFYI